MHNFHSNDNKEINMNNNDKKYNQRQTNTKRDTSFGLIHHLVKTLRQKLVDIFSTW